MRTNDRRISGECLAALEMLQEAIGFLRSVCRLGMGGRLTVFEANIESVDSDARGHRVLCGVRFGFDGAERKNRYKATATCVVANAENFHRPVEMAFAVNGRELITAVFAEEECGMHNRMRRMEWHKGSGNHFGIVVYPVGSGNRCAPVATVDIERPAIPPRVDPIFHHNQGDSS
jgi:hypothetical protein